MIPAPLLPYALLAVLLLVSGSSWFAYVKGGEHAEARITAQLAEEKAAQDEALQAVAREIAKIDVKHTTIRQKAEVITREVPVYRDCVHDDRTFGLLNNALSPPGSGPAGDSELPGADPAR